MNCFDNVQNSHDQNLINYTLIIGVITSFNSYLHIPIHTHPYTHIHTHTYTHTHILISNSTCVCYYYYTPTNQSLHITAY